MRENLSNNANHPVLYKDLYLRIIASLVGAHFIVSFGEQYSFFEIILMRPYYYGVIPSFAIAMILLAIIRQITIQLDKRFEWQQHTAQRISLQLFFGIVLPAVFAFLMAVLYFVARGMNIFKTTYLRFDYSLIVLQVLLINFYYAAYYLFVRWKKADEALRRLAANEPGPVKGREIFMVSKGASNIAISISDTACFFREANSNYLKTVSGEEYFLTQSLDEIQEQLPPQYFFRINRQLIAHRKAISGYDLLLYGKLEARLTVPVNTPVIISQKRASDFKKWIEN